MGLGAFYFQSSSYFYQKAFENISAMSVSPFLEKSSAQSRIISHEGMSFS